MNKLKMHTANKADENFRKLAELFPNAITETIDENGEVIRAIDKDILMQEINTKVVDGKEERYQFTWPDKKKSMLLANQPINKTLRPCVEESVGKNGKKGGFDSENLYIEGDNLEVLKLLQETYLGKIKMIYIDPPYNTGEDFVYNDDFKINRNEWDEQSGDYDEDGNRLVKNLDSNGRFHTDWLNMMYPRLKLAKDLLKKEGVIFISIGQEEITNLTKIGNEIFGECNQVGIISRVTKTASNNGSFFAPTIDYVLCYAKDINNLKQFVGEVDTSLYSKVEIEGDRKGELYRDDVALYQASLKDLRPNQKFFIECPDGSKVIPPCSKLDEIMRAGDGRWRWTKERYEKDKHLLVFKETKTSPLLNELGEKAKYNVYTKSYLSERQQTGTLPRDLWTDFINRKGADLLKKIKIPFDFSKPIELVTYMLKIANICDDDIILDFFSGSATTAHAVMQLNAEDGDNRKFIMVQLPEKTDEKSEANKAGYNNICEIGKERIRRAGKKIKEDRNIKIDIDKSKLMQRTLMDNGDFDDKYGMKITEYDEDNLDKLDIGFRVLKCDSTNMKDVYYNPAEYTQQGLAGLTDNIKEDRTPKDLLFQVMLDLGVLLSSKIEEQVIDNKKVFNVADGFLMACFDEDITEEVITKIAKEKPYYFVMRDKSMEKDSIATNFEQIFATYSPETKWKVL